MQQLLNHTNEKRLEERLTEGVGGLSERELIEMKSNSFCAAFQRDYRGDHRVVFFTGLHYTGAVAITAATTLKSLGYDVEVVVLNVTAETLPFYIEEAINQATSAEVVLQVVTTDFQAPLIRPEDTIVDAIYGLDQTDYDASGLKNVVRFLNAKEATKVALEIPTGLQAEGVVSEPDASTIFRSDSTYTFYAPKLAFLFAENEPFVGDWKVLHIGMDAECDEPQQDTAYYLYSEADLEGTYQPRPRFSHKYSFGRTLLIAGSHSMYGAIFLAGEAALYAGTGHLTLHVPKEAQMMAHLKVPEAIVHTDTATKHFSGIHLAHDYDAIAVGPGLGQAEETKGALLQLMVDYQKPMIIDADALNLMAKMPELLDALPKDSILTPHQGEFDRLFPGSTNSYERLQRAIQEAKSRGIYIILKGAYTAIISKSGHVLFSSFGNPGLASAGTGDVLTGILLAQLGQGRSPLQAAIMATYIHGFAADLYKMDYSEESLTASQLVAYIPRVMKALRNFAPIE